MYRRIMLPLDGSLFAEAAVPLALRLSKRAGAGLRLVTVVEPLVPMGASDPAGVAGSGEQYLEELADRIADDAGGDVTTAVRTGTVVEGLRSEAESYDADAVVMATHGTGGLSRFWLGSVALGFLHETDRPLILVRPREDGEPVSTVHWGFGRILVPLDGSELSERALSHATAFGKLFGAGYHLARIVVHPRLSGSAFAVDRDDETHQTLTEQKEEAAGYLETHADALRAQGLAVTTSVSVHPQAARGILAAITENACDSIAMATHGRGSIGRAVIGSTADKVLRGATVPVLLYRPRRE